MKRKQIRRAVKLVAKLAEYGYDTSERNRRAFNAAKKKYGVNIGTDSELKDYMQHIEGDMQRERERREAAEAKLAEVHKLTKAHCVDTGFAGVAAMPCR